MKKKENTLSNIIPELSQVTAVKRQRCQVYGQTFLSNSEFQGNGGWEIGEKNVIGVESWGLAETFAVVL